MDNEIEFIGFENEERLSHNEIPPDHAFETRDKIANMLKAAPTVKGNDRLMIFKFPFPGIGFKVMMYDESDGSEIKVVDGYSGNNKNYFVTFIPEATRTVSILVAVHRPIFVEFITRPKIVGVPPEPLIK